MRAFPTTTFERPDSESNPVFETGRLEFTVTAVVNASAEVTIFALVGLLHIAGSF